MDFIGWDEVVNWLRGKRVAVVGSAPSVLQNSLGFVDLHDVVVRVNNYKTGPEAGFRTDVFYSFFGSSIRKTAAELQADGVRLCMAKLPNSRPLESAWHTDRNKEVGIDYRYIYRLRAPWWFCPTFVPDDARFLYKFNLLGTHQPSTRFAAILDVLECAPASVYLTGFDFFTSGLHNVTDLWVAKNPDDPIKHRPEMELAWLAANRRSYPLTFDAKLTQILEAA